jgi:predicted DNA-binding transcriptional regulator AlpA
MNPARTLAGAAEIAAMLGVSRQRVQQLIKQPGFPKPYDVLAMGKVWKRAAVEAWAREHGRSPAA